MGGKGKGTDGVERRGKERNGKGGQFPGKFPGGLPGEFREMPREIDHTRRKNRRLWVFFLFRLLGPIFTADAEL